MKFYGVTAWLTNNCNAIITQYSKMSDFFLMFACSNFPFHASVIMIYCSILLLRWIQLCLLLTLSKSVFLNFRCWFRLYCIWFAYCQQESPWIVFLAFNISVPSSDLERINIWFMALIPLALHSFLLWFAQFHWRCPKSCCSLNLDLSSFHFE